MGNLFNGGMPAPNPTPAVPPIVPGHQVVIPPITIPGNFQTSPATAPSPPTLNQGAMIWIIALIFLFLGGGNFGFGNNGRGDYVTQSDLTNQLNAQSTQTQLQQLGIQTADNNYQTARLISEQTNQMLQQNNANLINAIQGFNTVNQNMTVGFNSINQNLTAGFAALAQQMCQLGYQMDKCCCEIKTQNLQNRLDDAQAALVNANANISNANQSQYILSQLGRFVAWTPSGTQAATVAAGG